jgi:hypothetical protein
MKQFFDELQKMYGLEAWGVRKGIGTHVTIEFGRRREGEPHPIGEYSLWISGAPWRLEKDGRMLSGSGQDTLSTYDLECLNGDRVLAVQTAPPYFDFVVVWESGRKLSVFCENPDPEVDTLVFIVVHGSYSLGSSGSITYEVTAPASS